MNSLIEARDTDAELTRSSGGLRFLDAPEETWNREADFLIVGGTSSMTEPLLQALTNHGMYGDACSNGAQALELLDFNCYKAVFCNSDMLGMTCSQLQAQIQTRFPKVALIVIASSGSLRQGMLAVLDGASSYLLMPCHPSAAIANMNQALTNKRLKLALANYHERPKKVVRW